MFQACKYAKWSIKPSCTRALQAPSEFQAVILSLSTLPVRSYFNSALRVNTNGIYVQ